MTQLMEHCQQHCLLQPVLHSAAKTASGNLLNLTLWWDV